MKQEVEEGYLDWVLINGLEEITFMSTFESEREPWWNRILFADLNGDGKLEIVTSSKNHWVSVGIYEVNDSSIERIYDYYKGD